MDLNSRTIFLSRDVLFHETNFPFKSPFNITADHSTSNSTLGLQNIPCSDHSSNSHCFPQNKDTTPTSPNNLSFYSSPASTPKDFELENSHVSSSPIAHDTPSSSPHIELRKSTRNRTAPKYLQDFHCQQAALTSDFQSTAQVSFPLTNCSFPLSNYLSYDCFSPKFQVFSSQLSIMVEPTSYSAAVKDLGWCKAMDAELQALEENQTWILIDLPPGKDTVDCKYVYKIKRNSDGSIERLKDRLVAKGYTQ
jgi:hypothetical protein